MPGRLVGCVFVCALLAVASVCLWSAAAALAPVANCASGGPYVIANPCPQGVPTDVFVGLAALALSFAFSAALARGFGPTPRLVALPLLLLGAAVSIAIALVTGRGEWWDVLEIAALASVGLGVARYRSRNSAAPSLLLGTRSLAGGVYLWGPAVPTAIRPRAVDVLAVAVTGLVGAVVGVVAGLGVAAL